MKKFAALLMIVSVASISVGCGNKTGKTAKTEKTTTTTTTTKTGDKTVVEKTTVEKTAVEKTETKTN